MKIIDNIVIINLKNTNNEYLIINSLNGLVDVVTLEEYKLLLKWQNKKLIHPENMNEKNLFNSLVQRQYIMSEFKEKKLKDYILNTLLEKSHSSFANPKSIGFIFSYQCNFICPYCYEKNLQNNKRMTIAMLNSIFAITNPDIHHINFFGGEPLLKDNMNLIQCVINHFPNSQYSITTNGYYLEEYYPILRNLDIKKIQVTIDGEEKKHNLSRTLPNQLPTYKKIIKGIHKFLKSGFNIRIRMNISFNNIQSCLREKEHLNNFFSHYSDNLTFELQPLFQYSRKEKSKIYQILDLNDRSCEKSNKIYESLPSVSRFIQTGFKIKPKIKPCTVEESIVIYDSNGDIYSCMLAVGNESRSIGKYYPNYHLYRNSYKTRSILTIDECSKCSMSLLCGGGCPNGVSSSNLNSPHCDEMIYEVNHRIPELYKSHYKKNR